MNAHEIAKILDEIGDLLELTEENPYRARAYYRGAQALRENPGCPLDDQDALVELPGIGDSLAGQISELAVTGRSGYYEELRRKVPAGFRKLLHIPGVGPKTIRLILRVIKPGSMSELLQAIEERQIRKIKGLSSKTEGKLKRGLEMMEDHPSSFGLGVALPLGREIVTFLEKLPGVKNASIVGSTARGRETVKDLDLLVGCNDQEKVVSGFSSLPKIEKVITEAGNHVRGLTWFGLPVDLYLVPPEAYPDALEHFRGDVGHHAKLRELAAAKGFDWSMIPGDAYARIGLPALPPELREADCELALPEDLLDLKNIRGDLHMHTRWSDGGYTIKEMALAALERGYEYIAICDHSQNLAIARGLKPEQLAEQRKEIDQVNQEMSGRIRVLAGTEIDILQDGRLDFPDEVLEDLDIVVASVHHRYKQNIDEMTERIELALKNPHVDILAHPTGRLISKREPFDLHLERVFAGAARNQKALEINASPSRLDLKDKYAALAKDFGIPIAIDTDAHSIEELADMEYGVMTARRGALEQGDVLNTKSLEELENWLHR